MTFRTFFYMLGAVFLTHGAQADSLQSLAQIEQAAYVYALNEAQAGYDNPQIIVDNLDTRLRLQSCDKPLETFSSSSSNSLGSRTIGVRCTAPTAWTVYVPVKVKVLREVIVTAKSLAANTRLTAADIRTQLMDISELHQAYLQSAEYVVGKQLKYPLAAGMVLPPRSLKNEKIVHRGERIMLVASAGAMEVRMNGTAMEDAALGERIKVKNSSSKRIVEGVVDAGGIVRVSM